MSSKDILMRVLALPSETRTIEFKRMGSRNEGLDRTLQSIVAMANTDEKSLFTLPQSK